HVRAHITSFIQHGRWQTNVEGKEGLDCVSALAALYLHVGEERTVQDRLFHRMAECYVANVDNLGCQAGQDSYITCRPGDHYAGTAGGLGLLAAACLERDGRLLWLREHLRGFALYWGERFCARLPPEPLSLPEEVLPICPERSPGVLIIPMQPWTCQVL